MVWKPPQNGRQSLAKEGLPVDTARQEEKKKTATIMEAPGDGIHEEQKHGRGHGRRQTSLAFGSGWTAFGCIDYIYKCKKEYIIMDVEYLDNFTSYAKSYFQLNTIS